jgi:hypothetical protein
MSRPAAAIVNTAQGVASYLDGISERKRANDVRRLCRSNVNYRSHLATLQNDNMQLRARVAELEAKHV